MVFFSIVNVLLSGALLFYKKQRLPGAVWLGGAAVVLLLLALGAALVVVTPYRYTFREARLDEMKATYRQMLARKSTWLRTATILFGAGLVAFAALIMTMLSARL